MDLIFVDKILQNLTRRVQLTYDGRPHYNKTNTLKLNIHLAVSAICKYVESFFVQI